MSSVPPTDVLPRRFGRYQLFDRIGRGGMADIYLARATTDIGATRLLVVKQILKALSNDVVFARMFIEEAKLCASLRHANVVQVLDLGREEGTLYIAMEYVEGLDLQHLLMRCSKAKMALPAEFAFFIVREALTGLDFAHRAVDADGKPLGIVHRDVSPSNVLISLEGEVKLCDFGIARAAGRQIGTEARAALQARVIGKSAYMSPEQARGEEIDARSDVFSAGILLWELCAGRRLRRGSEEEMLDVARRGEVPPLPDRGLPEQARLQAILDRALARDPEHRYPSAAAFRDELDAYVLAARLHASQIRFGEFLTEHFGADILVERRARERAARALEKAKPVELTLLPQDRERVDTATRAESPEPLIHEETTRPVRIADQDTDPERADAAVVHAAGEPEVDPFAETPVPVKAKKTPPPWKARLPTLAVAAIAVIAMALALAATLAR
jgi:serine/threonine-protein kinase